MSILKNKNSIFNIANLVTYTNITFGVFALVLISNENYIWACVFAWLAGFADIFDGKLARKYNLSTQFGIQLDSFADFLSFVIIPIYLVYSYFLKNITVTPIEYIVMAIMAFYIISGIIRLITFNLNSNEGEVEKYFTGIPTPLGAILLFVLFVVGNYIHIDILVIMVVIILIGFLLNSKIKIPHP